MHRRLRFGWIWFSIVALFLAASRLAAAAPNDAAAQKLRDQAIDQDYLATNYAAAEKKLTDALALCQKTSDCSPYVRGRLHADLGVIEYMLHKVDLARTEFATALMEDPSVTVDPNLSNSDVRREFAAVKGGATSGPAAAAAPPSGSQGGIVHTPAAQQELRTPLPLFAQVPDDIGATRVVLRYKPVRAKDWKTVPMHPMEGGYGVEIPCGDVGDREGHLEYYIQALDANGDVIATSGRQNAPHKVAIVKKVAGEPPHFPNQHPPTACSSTSAAAAAAADTGSTLPSEASDCPPGFPGCHEAPQACDTNDDCSAGEECVDKECRGPEPEVKNFKKNWLSLGVEVEDLIVSGSDNACAGGTGYTCFQGSTYYAANPAPNRDDKVLGGFASSPMVRIMVGYDRVVSRHVTLGARVGYAVAGGGPQRPGGPSFMPLHIEGRLAYWFGRNVFARKGVRPYLLIAAGMTEVDASQSIDVFSSPSSTTSIPINAWTKTGLGFAAGGGGLMYAITRSSGLALEAKAEFLFPTFGIAPALMLSYAVGL